jgi:O-Antigen ligase
VLVAGVVAVVAWGALAFGGVYPWAYTPLAIGCAIVGIAALAVGARGGPRIGALAAALAAIGIAAALQLAPLSPRIFALVSPGGDAFLRAYDFSYQLGAAGSTPAHSISIAPNKTALGLALYAGLAIFLLGTTRLLSRRGAGIVVSALVWFALVLSVIGIGQAALLTDKEGIVRQIYGFWQPRFGGTPFGPFVNRNHFAGWTIMLLPLAIASACAAWEEGSRAGAADIRDRVSWLSSRAAAGAVLMPFAAVVMGVALLMTQSRSGMAAFAAATLMFAWVLVSRQRTVRARMIVSLIVVVLFGGAVAWAGLDRIARRVAAAPEDAKSPTGRLQVWSDGLRIARDFPLTGSGLNTFGTAMAVYQTGDRHLQYQEAHNDYLQIAAEGGLLLGVPVCVALWIVVREVRRRFREAPREGTTYWLRVGAVIGLLAIGLQSLVEFSLQMPGNAALFAVVAAVALHRSPNLRVAS